MLDEKPSPLHKLITRRQFLRVLAGLAGLAFTAGCLPTPSVTPALPTETLELALIDTAIPTPAPTSTRVLPTTPSLPTRTSTPTAAPTDLNAWLKAHPNIAKAIVWQTPDNKAKVYADWSAEEKSQIATAVDSLHRGNWKNLAAEPPLAITPALKDTAITYLSPTVAWQYFVAYLAQTIVVEEKQTVPWSIANYPADELALLLDSRWFVSWNVQKKVYEIPMTLGHATPGDPVRTYGFLTTNKLIGTNSRDTIARLLNWSRDHLIHFSNSTDAANVYQHWQYYGSPPVEKMISGTISGAMSGSGLRHWTAGCWGTTGFLRAVLRTVNIPVKLEVRGGHALVNFAHEGLYLSHGDDPYNAFSFANPPIPPEELWIDRNTFEAWFGATVSEEKRSQNVGRRTIELALEYLSTTLLWYYCRDQSAVKSHANGELYTTYLKKYYTLTELENAQLWQRMDAKIAQLGGCSCIPSR